jgi:hypothetical protein
MVRGRFSLAIPVSREPSGESPRSHSVHKRGRNLSAYRQASIGHHDLTRREAASHQIEVGFSDFMRFTNMPNEQTLFRILKYRFTGCLGECVPKLSLDRSWAHHIDPERRKLD